jgi:hypothetical protein
MDINRGYRVSVGVWLAFVALAAGIVIVGSMLVTPDEDGMAFLDLKVWPTFRP